MKNTRRNLIVKMICRTLANSSLYLSFLSVTVWQQQPDDDPVEWKCVATLKVPQLVVSAVSIYLLTMSSKLQANLCTSTDR